MVHWQPMNLRRGSFDWSRTLVMAVVNATPDSFSAPAGSDWTLDECIAQGRALVEAGADLLDIGGESTRPGAVPVSLDEELRRTSALVEALAGHAIISIDTTKAQVAEAALARGAEIVNDVSGGQFEPALLDVVAAKDAVLIVGHTRGRPTEMADRADYADVVAEVIDELGSRLAQARQRGIRQLVADPGLGFAKRPAHDWAILAALPRIASELDVPLCIGASRKSFLGRLTGHPVGDRERATAAVNVAAILGGARMVRVHDVSQQLDGVRVADAIRSAQAQPASASSASASPSPWDLR